MCDCSSAVSSAQQSQVQTQIEIALAVKAQKATKQAGEAAVELIEAAAQIVVDSHKQFDARG